MKSTEVKMLKTMCSARLTTFVIPFKTGIIISFMFLWFAHETMAQSSTKTNADTLVGWVVNQKGKAMKDIPVSYPGKNVQRTDKKGFFEFPNVSLSDTLTIVLPKSRIWQIPVSGMSFLKITIRDNQFSIAEAKDEIINTGYGTAKKRTDPSGHVVISGDELRKSGQTDLMRALSGKVSGLSVVRNSDGEEKLYIRGGAPTLYAGDGSALYVVDGVVVDNFEHVDIYSVEFVTVMKEASIYGVRGANGAVVVKTK